MSAASVRQAIKSALSNGRVSKPEFQKIAQEAEKDGRVSRSEEKLIRKLVDNKYEDGFTAGARRESDSFFDRNDLPLAPTRITTAGPAGEEDGASGPPPGTGPVTTLPAGGAEEAGGCAPGGTGDVTTLPAGGAEEAGGCAPGGTGGVTTLPAGGVEDGAGPVSGPTFGRVTTKTAGEKR